MTALRLLAALALTAVAGCDGGEDDMDAGRDSGGGEVDGGMVDGGPPPSAELTVTPSMQDFGDVVVDQTSAAATFTFENVGDGNSDTMDVTLQGGGADEFVIESDDCTGSALSPGGTCDVSVTYRPSAAIPATASLRGTDGDASAAATLEGNGVEAAGLAISPTPHNFGATTVGSTAGPQSFTVTNVGDEESGTITITLGGIDSTQFGLGADGCSGMTLAAGATCTVEAVYMPTSAGSHSADLQATASPGSTATAALSGTANTPANLQLVPGSQDFGTVVEGSSSSDVTFTLTNTGGLASGTISHPFSGTNASEFSVVTSTCAGVPLAGGASCTIVVRFNAGSPGTKSASLDVTDGTLSAAAALTATSVAVGSVIIEPSTNDYGTSSVGSATGAFTFTVRNTGGSPTGALSVAIAGSNPADFPIVPGGDGCSGSALPGGDTCTVAVQFNPTVAGGRSATLRVAGTPGGTATAALTGTGLAPATIEVTPTAADFGSVATGTSSSTVSFTVRNSGGSPTGTPSVSLTGLQSTQFSIVSNGCSAPIAGGDTCTVTVRFSPTSTGMKAAVLEVTASPGGTDTADLGGIGITPAALTLMPTSASFGMVAETDSADRTFIVNNTGAAPVTSLTFSISGTHMGQFMILPSTTCGSSLAGGANCNIEVRFTPAGQGARSATLNVNGTPGGMLTAALSGTGIPDLLLQPDAAGDSFDYGDVIIGNSDTTVFRVTNQTTRTLTSLTIAAPPTSGAEFTRTATTCGSMLGSGASCTVTIRFAPTGTAGSRTAPFTVTGSGGATETATLDGDAVGPIRFTQWEITTPAGGTPSTSFPAAFGSRSIGGIYEATLTAQNTGTLTTDVIMTSASFSGDLNIVGDSCSGSTLASGATCTVVVRFYPRATGAASGMVTLDYGTNTTTANVSATGVVGASIGVTGTTSFGTVIATQTQDRTYTVTNASPTETTGVLSYFLSGGSSRFSIVTGAGGGTCPVSGGATSTLAGGASCTIVVRFAPVRTDLTTSSQSTTLVVQQGAQTVNTTLTGSVSSIITVTPTSQMFQTGVGTTSAPVTFTVRNVGASSTGSIVVAAFNSSTDGSPSAQFPVSSNTCSTLAPGATCTFDVAFAPTSTVDIPMGQLRVSDGAYAAGTARVATSTLNGDAASQPQLQVVRPQTTSGFVGYPGPYPRFMFGWVVAGANSASADFVVRNDGDLPSGPITATLLTDTVFGHAPSNYSITANTCSAGLAAGATCAVSVRFNPPVGSDNQWRLGHLQVTGAPGGTVDFYLQGGSVPPNSLTVTPTPSYFGETPGGTTIGPRTFMVANNSGGPLTITGIAPVNTTRWTVSAGTCTGVLAGGATCTFSATYAPPASAPYGFDQDIIEVTSSSTFFSGYVAVNGISQAPAALNLSPSGTVTYPSTTSGQSSSQVFTVSNTGDVATAATPSPSLGGADPGQFAIVSNTCTAALPGGGSCTFAVEFRPTGAGGRSASLSVSAGGGLSAGASLSGTGLAAALLGISPSAPQTCPAHYAGSDVHPCVTYTVTNGGGSTAPLTVGVTGDFDINPASTCVTSPNLGPGGSCSAIVRHTPQTVGADSGTLTVSSPGVSSVTGTISSSGIAALERTAGNPAVGSTAVGGMGITRTFTITNQANPATSILYYSVAGAHAGDFDVTTDNCSGTTLSSGGFCTITVRFIPTATGTRNATLTVEDGSTGGNKSVSIMMSGTGT